MLLRRLGLLVAFLVGFMGACFPIEGANENIFTIVVSAPISPKDIQIRYFLTGDFGGHWFSTATQSDGNKIVVKTGVEGKSARTFKAIIYAPGCQFVTIAVDDLFTSSRRGEFQCQKLPTLQFRGRASGFVQKDWQLEALYGFGWAMQFFGISGGAVSPFSIAKASVEADGSFTVELPDFSGDPLWSSLSNDATLMFFLVDTRSGQRLAVLKPSADLSRGDSLKVAPSYPAEVEFTMQPQGSGMSLKSPQ